MFRDLFDGALGLVILTSKNVRSWLLKIPRVERSSLALSSVFVPGASLTFLILFPALGQFWHQTRPFSWPVPQCLWYFYVWYGHTHPTFSQGCAQWSSSPAATMQYWGLSGILHPYLSLIASWNSLLFIEYPRDFSGRTTVLQIVVRSGRR